MKKKIVSLIMILVMPIFAFAPTIVNADENVWIDNTIDNSMSYVTGKVVITDSNTGEVTTEVVYDESVAVTFSNPRSEAVQGMINEATALVNSRASEISSNFDISTDETTGTVWDNRKYEISYDGGSIIIGDTNTSELTATYVASGDYGKNTYYVVTANVTTEDDNKTYTLSNDLATVIFTFEKDHDFELNMIDLLTINPEDVEEMFGIDEETFNNALDTIRNNAKQYGDLISIYNIMISEGTFNYTSATALKINLVEAMKKYNTLKLLYLDDENNFKVADVYDLAINSETADIDLDHLSVYALVGNHTESTVVPTNTSIDNPKTGDNIALYISTLVLSIITLVGTSKYMKKEKFN